MKSLKDLADEWGETLLISYLGNTKEYVVSFPFGAPVKEGIKRFGYGPTLKSAMEAYAIIIRGEKINFGSFKYSNIKQVPEILTSDL
jgi:hypothetical protein